MGIARCPEVVLEHLREPTQNPEWMAQSAVVRDYRALETG
jgi:hypothetical protein